MSIAKVRYKCYSDDIVNNKDLEMRKVVSFSGGRTSAYLCHLMIEKFGRENVDFIYMDTGAEHPKTYEFIRKVDEYFGLNLVCLRTVFSDELGTANSYEIISVNDINQDLAPWVNMLKKYGTPYNPGGAFCTDRMKLVPFTKYCNDTYGRGNYETWLGIRADEPKRIKPKAGYDYMATISDFEKEDVLKWWSSMPFNLEIEEHLGNCVFCIKKGVNKIALAARDESEQARAFVDVITSDNVRIVEQRKSPSLEMYRGRQSLQQVIATFSLHTRDEIAATIRGAKRYDSGSCSESCEVFNGDNDEPYSLTIFHNGATLPVGESVLCESDPSEYLGEPDSEAGSVKMWNVEHLRIVVSRNKLTAES